MLRFATISLSTFGVLAGLFFVLVWRAQPQAVAPGAVLPPVVPTQVSSQQTSSGVGPGQKPWAENFENGKLTSKFTATEFTPQKDGSFLVDHPISIFFLEKGQWMRVTGDTGVVNCDSSGAAGSKSMFSGPTSSPRNGSLHHVVVELFPEPNATRATERLETDNIHFDNETLRMYTENFVDPQGNTVLADEVPVTLRGDEYEFDGKGLTLIWDINKHLEKLEIAHGKRLEIINPSKLTLPGMSPAEPVQHAMSGDPFAGMLASVDRSAVSLVMTDAQTPAAPKVVDPPLPYRAVFHHQVKITEGDRTMAVADVMTVDFLQGSGKTKTPAVALGAPAAPLIPTPPVVSMTPAQSATTESSTTKATKGPITIYWTGSLLVTPLKSPPMLPISPGQSVVRLVGSPVRLTPEGSEVLAASATYRNPDGAVELLSSNEVPQVRVTQDKGLTLSTGSVVYDPATAIAILSGVGELHVPVNKNRMDVSWSKQGLLHVIRVPGQPNGVDHIDLTDDVAVNHPEFTLNTRRLQLDLDLIPKVGGSATDSDEQLKLLTATDNVSCRLIHPGKPTQGIDGDRLVIRTERTAHKETMPREVIADGHVHAFDPEQSITAGHLDALLIAKANTKSSTKTSPDDVGQAVDLETLYASSAVHALLKNGATADAEELKVTTVDGKQFVDLRGPDGAMLKDGKGSWLKGPIVYLVPDRNSVSVDGPGMMETIRRASTTRPAVANAAPPKPVDVSWTDSMTLDGSANTADVFGRVTVKNVDAIGTASNITGDKAHLDLVDIPKNKQKSTQTDEAGGKTLKKLILTGNVVGFTELDDSAGAPLRRGNVYGDQLIYTAADGTAIIPGPGKLFVENHKPDEKGQSNSRGAMAIQWNRQLTYDQNTQIINIDGDTRVGFEQEPKPGKPARPQAPMQLNSQRLIVTLAKAVSTTAPTTQADQGKLTLSHLQAIDRVRFIANGLDLTCGTMDYDPKTSIMTLSSTPDEPGRAMNVNQAVTGTFEQLHYNTATEEMVDAEELHGTVRR